MKCIVTVTFLILWLICWVTVTSFKYNSVLHFPLHLLVSVVPIPTQHVLVLPKTKLSGLKICPKGPERTESMVPGSKSTRMARGTNLLPVEKRTRLCDCTSLKMMNVSDRSCQNIEKNIVATIDFVSIACLCVVLPSSLECSLAACRTFTWVSVPWGRKGGAARCSHKFS